MSLQQAWPHPACKGFKVQANLFLYITKNGSASVLTLLLLFVVSPVIQSEHCAKAKETAKQSKSNRNPWMLHPLGPGVRLYTTKRFQHARWLQVSFEMWRTEAMTSKKRKQTESRMAHFTYRTSEISGLFSVFLLFFFYWDSSGQILARESCETVLTDPPE